MSKVRTVLAASALLGGLGCSGLGEKLMELSGAEIHVGADAVRPADFPLPAPEGGTLMSSVSMGIAGSETTTLQYEVGEGKEAILDRYEALMKDAGRTVNRSGTTVNGQGTDGSSWSALVTEQGGKQILSLVVMKLPAR